MNFLAVGLCIEISTGLLFYYMKLHNAWLLKTLSSQQQQQQQQRQQPVTVDLENTAKAVDHVKIESI